jgi:hypothetical protein
MVTSLLHDWDEFPVNMLQPLRSASPALEPELIPLPHGRLHVPERALRSQLCRDTWHVLIKWTDMSEAEATWEPVEVLKATHHAFVREDEQFPE